MLAGRPVGDPLTSPSDLSDAGADLSGGTPVDDEPVRADSERSAPVRPTGDLRRPGPGGGSAFLVDRRPKNPLKKVADYALLVVIAVVLASLIRSFVGLAFYIPSESMYPTLKINDRVIVSRVSYRFGEPKRGQVVVFRNPHYTEPDRPNIVERVGRVLFEIIGSRQPKDKNYIKRVIGVPGDRLMFKDGYVYVNGTRLDEPWLQPGITTSFEGHENVDIAVPPDKYFMMGDNRGDSCDSRCFPSADGTPAPTFIDKSAIVGRAFHRIWPLSRFGSL